MKSLARTQPGAITGPCGDPGLRGDRRALGSARPRRARAARAAGLALSLVLAVGVAAPDAQDAAEPDAGGAESQERDRVLEVAPSDGTVLRSDREVNTVLVADPDVVDVRMVSDRTLFLYGKAVGRTRIMLLGADDELMQNIWIEVRGTLPDIFSGR